jgi:hypothetical protein
MKPEERLKKMERDGWQMHRKWFWLDRIIMVRIGLNQEPEYATIFHDGKLRHGNHGPVKNHTIGETCLEYPVQDLSRT